MKLHEYQSKQIFAENDIPIPKGRVAMTAQEARSNVRTFVMIHDGRTAMDWRMRRASPRTGPRRLAPCPVVHSRLRMGARGLC